MVVITLVVLIINLLQGPLHIGHLDLGLASLHLQLKGAFLILHLIQDGHGESPRDNQDDVDDGHLLEVPLEHTGFSFESVCFLLHPVDTFLVLNPLLLNLQAKRWGKKSSENELSWC